MPSSACKKSDRSEEHTSELQSHDNLVCRLLLEKKNRCGRTSPHRPPPRTSWRSSRGPPPQRHPHGTPGGAAERTQPHPRALALGPFFFNDPPPPEISPLPLPDPLPI